MMNRLDLVKKSIFIIVAGVVLPVIISGNFAKADEKGHTETEKKNPYKINQKGRDLTKAHRMRHGGHATDKDKIDFYHSLYSHITRNAAIIGLSDKQKDNISKIELESQKQQIMLNAEKRVIELELKVLMTSDKFDKQEMLKKADEISIKATELTKIKMKGIINILSTLTEDQRKVIRSMHGDTDILSGK